MPSTRCSASLTDLARTARGATVLIRLVLFDLVREQCEELGIRSGTTVRIVDGTPTHLQLEVDGAVVLLPREWSRFIDACPVERAAA